MHRVPAGWCLLLGLASACAESRPPLPSVARLWRDLAPVQRSDDAPVSGTPRPWRRVEAGGSDRAWYRVRFQQQRFAFEPLPAVRGGLRLVAQDGHAVVTILEVPAGEALELRLVARIPGAAPGTRLPVAALVQLRAPLNLAAGLQAEEALQLWDPERSATRLLQATAGDDAGELSVELVLERSTLQLALFLLAPTQPEVTLQVSALRLRTRSVVAHLVQGGKLPRLERLADGSTPDAVRVRMDRDEREGLLALAPSRFTWRVPAGGAGRRLDLSLGLRPRRAGGRVRFQARFAGQVLLDEVLAAPVDPSVPAWNDRVVQLPAWPDGAALLELSTEPMDADPPLAVLGHPTLLTPREAAPPNVLLICLDTLRPDRLGCYGGDPALSPRIDALAAEGHRFAAAYPTSSYTLPSHGSLLTGQYPALHGAVNVTDRLDAERSPLLARQLARAGWITAAFTGGGYVSADFGFGAGFDRYSHNDPVWALDTLRGQQLIQTVSWQRAPVQEALLRRYDARMITDWIGRQEVGTPFFLFAHTYIVHNYAPDEARLRQHGLLRPDGSQRPFNHQRRVRFNQGETGLREEVHQAYMPFYDATIRMADEFVGGLLDALREGGLLDHTLVVLTSDHGEEFGEHGFFGHGETLFDGNARCPLILRLPGGGAPSVVDGPVSQVDLAPWILRRAGLEADERMERAPLEAGAGLLPPIRPVLFVELDTQVSRESAVVAGALKLRARLGEDGADLPEERWWLYDMHADPGETTDLSAERAADADRLRRLLAAFHEHAQSVRPRDGPEAEDAALDPELRLELQQLGYLQGQEGGPR